MNKIIVKTNNSKGYDIARDGDYLNISQPKSITRRGRVGHGISQTLDTSASAHCVVVAAYDEQNKYIRKDGCVGTLTTNGSSPKHNNRVIVNCDVVAAAMRDISATHGKIEQQIEISDRNVANTITTVQKDSLVAKVPLNCECIKLGNVNPSGKSQSGNVYDSNGLGVTLTANGGVGAKTGLYVVNGDVSKTVRAGGHGSLDRHSWYMVEHPSNLRIRKLTPKECFRLMGFDDESFERAAKVNSNTQLYKQAGNSIVVDVLEEIFCMMFDEDGMIYV